MSTGPERYYSYVDKNTRCVSYVYNIYALVLLPEAAYSDQIYQDISVTYVIQSLPFILSAIGILILSNENAEKYMDEKTMLFNQYSFETVLEEFDFEKQKLYIVVICFCRAEMSLREKASQ